MIIIINGRELIFCNKDGLQALEIKLNKGNLAKVRFKRDSFCSIYYTFLK